MYSVLALLRHLSLRGITLIVKELGLEDVILRP